MSISLFKKKNNSSITKVIPSLNSGDDASHCMNSWNEFLIFSRFHVQCNDFWSSISCDDARVLSKTAKSKHLTKHQITQFSLYTLHYKCVTILKLHNSHHKSRSFHDLLKKNNPCYTCTTAEMIFLVADANHKLHCLSQTTHHILCQPLLLLRK